MTYEQPMFTTYLVNLYNRDIFKTSLYMYIFQDEKCLLMRNLSLSHGSTQDKQTLASCLGLRLTQLSVGVRFYIQALHDSIYKPYMILYTSPTCSLAMIIE